MPPIVLALAVSATSTSRGNCKQVIHKTSELVKLARISVVGQFEIRTLACHSCGLTPACESQKSS